jgi:hypothetical protein
MPPGLVSVPRCAAYASATAAAKAASSSNTPGVRRVVEPGSHATVRNGCGEREGRNGER